MKKAIAVMLAVTMLFAVCGTAIAEPAETSAPVMKILQDRVLDVTYSTFDFDGASGFMTAKYGGYEPGGCSAIKTVLDGKVYVGRNMDFYCTDSPAFIVRNNAGKYRTVGIGNSPDSLPAWTENYTLSDTVLSALPYLCCDVLSENGLYIETNIRYSEEGLACTSTNPGAPRRCTQCLMQIMLSRYSTIDEIISHIDDYDWFDLSSKGFCQAFLLADQSGRSVVIEFAANTWKVTESDYQANFFIDNAFYAVEKYPIGLMRISKELAYRPYVRTPEDIFTMMEQGSYFRFYSSATDLDYALDEWYKDVGYTRFDLEASESTREEAKAKTLEGLHQYDTYTWEQHIAERSWETTFCTVANLTDLTLSVHFSEHYGITFEVGFEEA